jgi:hypothetical protein
MTTVTCAPLTYPSLHDRPLSIANGTLDGHAFGGTGTPVGFGIGKIFKVGVEVGGEVTGSGTSTYRMKPCNCAQCSFPTVFLAHIFVPQFGRKVAQNTGANKQGVKAGTPENSVPCRFDAGGSDTVTCAPRWGGLRPQAPDKASFLLHTTGVTLSSFEALG